MYCATLTGISRARQKLIAFTSCNYTWCNVIIYICILYSGYFEGEIFTFFCKLAQCVNNYPLKILYLQPPKGRNESLVKIFIMKGDTTVHL